MTLFITTVETPTLPLTFVVDDHDVVIGSGFTGEADVLARLSDAQRAQGVERGSDLGAVPQAVKSYLAGEVTALDAVAVSQPGGAFHQRVWQHMRRIPAGSTASYAELAAAAGNPAATRAAGSACARNQVAPFVPCHRVVRSDGSLGGYYYGLAVKRWLLAHERGQLTATAPQASSAGRRPSSGGS